MGMDKHGLSDAWESGQPPLVFERNPGVSIWIARGIVLVMVFGTPGSTSLRDDYKARFE